MNAISQMGESFCTCVLRTSDLVAASWPSFSPSCLVWTRSILFISLPLPTCIATPPRGLSLRGKRCFTLFATSHLLRRFLDTVCDDHVGRRESTPGTRRVLDCCSMRATLVRHQDRCCRAWPYSTGLGECYFAAHLGHLHGQCCAIAKGHMGLPSCANYRNAVLSPSLEWISSSRGGSLVLPWSTPSEYREQSRHDEYVKAIPVDKRSQTSSDLDHLGRTLLRADL